MSPTELQQHLQRYVDLRHALGFPLGKDIPILHQFAHFAATQTHAEPITTRTVFDWLEVSSAPASPYRAARRLSLVRQFLLHLSATVPGTEIPELRLLATYRRPTPFLFTPAETAALVNATATFGAEGSFLRVTLRMLFGLLVCTGLRISEALGLDRADVMPRSHPGVLWIRDTKFHKSRLVPVHPSTAAQLATYAGHRELLGYSRHTPAFFVSCHPRRLSAGTVQRAFRQILDDLGIRAREGSRPPTIHALRHTFVVTRLLRWHQEGVDVNTRLAHLATYLGHTDFRGSYWYLTATPELLRTAAAAFAADHPEGGAR